MPTYTIRNKKTGKAKEEFFSSWSKLEEYLKENPDLEQGINTFTGIGDPHRMGMRKPDEGFRDLLRRIKKNNAGSDLNIL